MYIILEPLRRASVKIGTIQRRLAWPLRKDDTQIREAFHIFVRDGILSVADYNLTRVGVVVVVVVVNTFLQWDNLRTL